MPSWKTWRKKERHLPIYKDRRLQGGRHRHGKIGKAPPRTRNSRRQQRTRHVMNVEQGEESPVSTIRRKPPPTDSSKSDYVEAMSVGNVMAAMESGEFDLDDTTLMDSTPFRRVYINDSGKTSELQQIRSLASFIRTRNRSFQYWRTRINSENIEQLKPRGAEQPRRPDWQHHIPRRRSNRYQSPSTGASTNFNDATTRSVRFGPPPTSRASPIN